MTAALAAIGRPRPETGFAALTDAEFRLFQRLIYAESGIFLTATKRDLLMARLARRLRALKLRSFGAYYRRAKSNPEERARMFDCITTNETGFFREPRQFAFLRETLLPSLRADAAAGLRPRRVRAWSAGCSTGEEPYSLAMTLLDGLPGWNVEIFATDLSTRVLAHAQTGIWPARKAKEIPERYLKRYMLKGLRRQANKIRVGPELRALVEFRRLNLHQDDYTGLGPFDLIFCRNVLIYFDAESRLGVIQRLLRRIHEGGYLLVGHAESLGGVTDVRGVMPTIYRLRPNAIRQTPTHREASS